jgi:hypothetical protein
MGESHNIFSFQETGTILSKRPSLIKHDCQCCYPIVYWRSGCQSAESLGDENSPLLHPHLITQAAHTTPFQLKIHSISFQIEVSVQSLANVDSKLLQGEQNLVPTKCQNVWIAFAPDVKSSKSTSFGPLKCRSFKRQTEVGKQSIHVYIHHSNLLVLNGNC